MALRPAGIEGIVIKHWLPLRILSQPAGNRWPWLACFGAWTVAAAGLGLFATTNGVALGPRWGPRLVTAVGALLLSPMGAVIATRQPHNPIGWTYCSVGLLCAVQFAAQEYAALALLALPGRLPAGEWLAWLQNWIWAPAAALYLIYIPLLLPAGRLPSAGWRPVAGIAGLAAGLLAACFALQPGPLENFSAAINPAGLWPSAALWRPLRLIAFGLVDASLLAAAVSLVWRMRRAAGHERQQLRWLAFAVTLGSAGILASTLTERLAAPLFVAAVAAMHAATGQSILRYRLYDLDVVINRTVMYGLLTAVLAGAYFGSVAVLQTLTLALTGERYSEPVVIVSTLAIAALFNPLKGLIQHLIDRRFFRSRYDAAQALERFGHILRDDYSSDPGHVTAHLVSVVEETMQPASVSLWLAPRYNARDADASR